MWNLGRRKSTQGMSCSSNTLLATLFALCHLFQQTLELNPDLMCNSAFFPCWLFPECHHEMTFAGAAPASLLRLCNDHRLSQCQGLEGPSGDHSAFAGVWACSPGQDFTFPFAELMRHLSAHSPAYGDLSGCQHSPLVPNTNTLK